MGIVNTGIIVGPGATFEATGVAVGPGATVVVVNDVEEDWED